VTVSAGYCHPKWAFLVVLAVYAYEQGGTTAVALAALVRMVPAGLAAPFAGLLIDRSSRRDVLLGTDVARALALTGIAAAVAAAAPLAVVLALSAVFTVLQAAHLPAQAALFPTLATTPRQLAASNAVASSVDNGGVLVGSLVGGVLVAATSADSAFVEGAVDVLVVLLAIELLDLGGEGVGWLNAAWGVGGLLAGAAAISLIGRGRLAAGIASGGLLAGACLQLLALPPDVVAAVAIGIFVLIGVGYGLIEIAGTTLLQRSTSDQVLGRAFAVVETGYWLSNGPGRLSRRC
jgi:hypothetical protein